MKPLKLFAVLVAIAATVLYISINLAGGAGASNNWDAVAGLLILVGIVVLAQTKRALYIWSGDYKLNRREKKRAAQDKREGTSAKKYQELLKTASYTRDQARQMLTQQPKDFDQVVRRVSEAAGDQRLTIPMFTYIEGLPGEHLLRTTAKPVSTLAYIEGGSIVFSKSMSENYKGGSRLGAEIARLPASAVRKIVVIDLDYGRRSKKIKAKARDIVVGTLNGGALHLNLNLPPTAVCGAVMLIKYINEDGVELSAKFLVPLGIGGNEATISAIEKVLSFREKVEDVSSLGELLAGASFLDGSPFLSIPNHLLSLVDKTRTVVKLLSAKDEAIPAAKASAEMLALFTQNPGFTLEHIQQSQLHMSQ